MVALERDGLAVWPVHKEKPDMALLTLDLPVDVLPLEPAAQLPNLEGPTYDSSLCGTHSPHLHSRSRGGLSTFSSRSPHLHSAIHMVRFTRCSIAMRDFTLVRGRARLGRRQQTPRQALSALMGLWDA